MSEALLRVAIATKGMNYDGASKLIVVAIRFGGLVLERTVTQYFTRRVVENPNGQFQPFARSSRFRKRSGGRNEAVQLLTMLKDRVKPQP